MHNGRNLLSLLGFFVVVFCFPVTAHNIHGHFYSTVEWPYFTFVLQIHELFLPVEFSLCVSVGNTSASTYNVDYCIFKVSQLSAESKCSVSPASPAPICTLRCAEGRAEIHKPLNAPAPCRTAPTTPNASRFCSLPSVSFFFTYLFL